MKSYTYMLAGVLIASGAAMAFPAQAQVAVPQVSASVQRSCAAMPVGTGTSGDSVRSLQAALKAEGYMTSEPTGYFGPITSEAVRRYQAEHGIPATGYAGALTLAAINKNCASMQAPAATAHISLSVAPEKAQYAVGADIRLVLKAYNDTEESQTLTFGNACQASYVIDAYSSKAGKICAQGSARVVIEPGRSYSWIMTHRPAEQKIQFGKHPVSATLEGYGSATTTTTVR